MEHKRSVGLGDLPKHMNKKTIKRGIQFTIMVVGESGLGKSTLINSLYMMDFNKGKETKATIAEINPTVSIVPTTVELEEDGVKVRLTIVDTPGFGDGLNSSNCIEKIVNYLNEQHERYHLGETSLHRKYLPDSRVHACLYFISPFGHGLKPIDIQFITAIHFKVNFIPIIAKADALTKKELTAIKAKLMDELADNHVRLFVPENEDRDFEDDKELDHVVRDPRIPFAVCGADTTVKVGEEKAMGRLYPWGFLDVENPKFSDLSVLRQFLIENMHDLIEDTHEVLYETYRLERLLQQPLGIPPVQASETPIL